MELDLSSLISIKRFAATIKPKYNQIDILINNASIHNDKFEKTKDGIESNFAINYLGHFLLTNMLLDILMITPQSRIINITSMTHYLSEKIDLAQINSPPEFKDGWFTESNYSNSKLAIVLFTQEL